MRVLQHAWLVATVLFILGISPVFADTPSEGVRIVIYAKDDRGMGVGGVRIKSVHLGVFQNDKWATTDETGRAELMVDEPGQYEILVTYDFPGEGWRYAREYIDVTANRPVQLELNVDSASLVPKLSPDRKVEDLKERILEASRRGDAQAYNRAVWELQNIANEYKKDEEQISEISDKVKQEQMKGMLPPNQRMLEQALDGKETPEEKAAAIRGLELEMLEKKKELEDSGFGVSEEYQDDIFTVQKLYSTYVRELSSKNERKRVEEALNDLPPPPPSNEDSAWEDGDKISMYGESGGFDSQFVSFSLSGGVGQLDRGKATLPVGLEVGALQFELPLEVDLDDNDFVQVDGEVELNMGEAFLDPRYGAFFVTGHFHLGFSDVDERFDSLSAGGDPSALFAPTADELDSIRILPASGSDHSDIKFSSDYEEGIVGAGVRYVTPSFSGFTFEPSLGFFYGWTSDDQDLSGWTADNRLEYEFDSKISSDRWGVEPGLGVSYAATEWFRINLKGSLRFVHNEADGKSSFTSWLDGAPFTDSSNGDISDSQWDVGLILRGGFAVTPIPDFPNLELFVEGGYERWEAPLLFTPPDGAAEIDWQDRESFTINAGVSVGF